MLREIQQGLLRVRAGVDRTVSILPKVAHCDTHLKDDGTVTEIHERAPIAETVGIVLSGVLLGGIAQDPGSIHGDFRRVDVQGVGERILRGNTIIINRMESGEILSYQRVKDIPTE